MWRAHSIKGIAYLQHLYSQSAHGAESDAVERWLAEKVDSPSEVTLAKVAKEERLTSKDWGVLLRFFAASQSRTPAFYLRRRAAWDREVQPRINTVLQNTVSSIEHGLIKPARSTREAPLPEGAEIPARVRVTKNPDGQGGVIEAEMLAGRKLWFFEMKRILNYTWSALRALRWTVIRPPVGRLWLTSDDPAVVARIAGGKVTFNGGWHEPSSVLILPLEPEHVLFGTLKGAVPVKYSHASESDAEFIQNCIVRHAHRMIFGREKDDWVETVRTRRVDPDAYQHERNEWQRWHLSQTKAEQDLEDDSTWHTARGGPA